MKILYFDCFSGISGDMILGALLDLGLDLGYLKTELSKLKLKGYRLSKRTVRKNGFRAAKFDVTLTNKTSRFASRRSLKEIKKIINRSGLSGRVKKISCGIFDILAAAECRAHGCPKDKVHFHEVGDIDSIVDVAGSVMGIERLGIKKIYCSAINTGSGSVKSRHGLLPVPAPATAFLLKGMKAYSHGEGFELATPTGVGILKGLGCVTGDLPQMSVDKIGIGAGGFNVKERPNLLRAFLGRQAPAYQHDTVSVIQANIDDMSPIGSQHILERLYKAGALEANFGVAYGKKSRIGLLLTVITDIAGVPDITRVIFEETPSLGVRVYQAGRFKLKRQIKHITTKYGKIRVKIGTLPDGGTAAYPEYDDCSKIASKRKVPFRKIYEEARR